MLKNSFGINLGEVRSKVFAFKHLFLTTILQLQATNFLELGFYLERNRGYKRKKRKFLIKMPRNISQGNRNSQNYYLFPD